MDSRNFRGISSINGLDPNGNNVGLYPLLTLQNVKKVKYCNRPTITVAREIQMRIHDEHFVRPIPAVAEVQMYSDKTKQDKKGKEDSTRILNKCLGGKYYTTKGLFFPEELITGQKVKINGNGVVGGKRTSSSSGNIDAAKRLRTLYDKEKEVKRGKGDEEEEIELVAGGGDEEENVEDETADYTKDYYASDNSDDDGGGGDEDEGGTF